MAKQRRVVDNFDLSLEGRPPIKPRNQGQADYLKAIARSTMTVGIGPAGTGKTFLAACHAAEQLVTDKVDGVVITRPAVTIEGENHGFLPGDLNKKMEPFTAPVFEAFYDRIGRDRTIKLLQAGKLRIVPFGYMRGLTFKNKIVLVDEAQNMTPAQAKALVTRIGEGTSYIINGDLQQSDIQGENGLWMLQRLINRHEMPIPVVTFTEREVVRSEMCRRWVEVFEKELM